MNRAYRCEYTFTIQFGDPRHTWAAVGQHGGLHLHITDHGEEHGRKYGERYSGGIEIHWRQPPDYKSGPPDHDQCWLLKCPCWHDGSSLQATETWIPIWLSCPHDHEHMFNMLCVEADKYFNTDTE